MTELFNEFRKGYYKKCRLFVFYKKLLENGLCLLCRLLKDHLRILLSYSIFSMPSNLVQW